MYDTDGYHIRPVSRFRGSDYRTWLIVAGSLAAALALLVFVVAASSGPSNQSDPPASAVEPTPTTGESSKPPNDTADGVGAVAPANGGDQDGQDDSPAQEPEEEPADEPEEEPAEEVGAPLSIEVSVDKVAPGGNCFASGTIAVSGGTYPVKMHFQWRHLTFGGGLDGEPVSPVANYTFTEAGGIHVETYDLPEDGTNVYLLVAAPKQKGSGLVEYAGCSPQTDDAVLQGN